MNEPIGWLSREPFRLEEEIVANWRSSLSQSPWMLWALVISLTATVFMLDLLLPLGWAPWILYIVVVILAAQWPEVKHARSIALVCTALILIGFWFSPDSLGVPLFRGAVNRAVGILALWITALVGMQCTTAEKRERTGRRLLRTTLLSIGDGVIATDASGRITFLNPVAEKLMGCTAAEAQGGELQDFFQIVDEETRQPVANPALRALKEGVVFGLANHTVLIGKDGSERPIADSAAPVHDVDGRVIGAVLVFRDITDTRQAEKTRSTLAAIVTSSEDAIASKDLNGRVMTWNKSAEEIFGYSADEIIGKPITVLFPQERLQEEEEILRRVRRGERIEHYETIRLKKDGTPIDISVSVSPVRDESGRIVGAAKIARDITERRRAEQELRDSRERLNVTLNSIGDAVVATDAAGRVTFINPVARDLLGYTPEQATGRVLKEVFNIVYEETRQPAENPIERVVREGNAVGLGNHTLLLRPDNREIPIDDSAAPIRGADGTVAGVVLVFRDITERRQAQQALLEADRRKDLFLALLAHELRNPLAPIRNAAQVLQIKCPREEELFWCCDVIDSEVKHMARLLDDLLDIGRITQGKMEIRKEVVDLSTIVQRAVETSRPYIEDRHHTLEVELPRESLLVDADPTRMVQVFANLLNNAAKYTAPGGKINVRLERAADQALVTVRDTGIGIAADLLPKIFDMFVQGENVIEDTNNGLGLGLTLARDIVDIHGGKIEVKSKGPAEGSEFTVHLPLSNKERMPAPASGRPSSEAPTDGKRVLIVDDNRNQARTLARLLDAMGHEATVAYDGAAALELAADFRPDVALIDIGLPGMSGYDVARRLREQPTFREVLLVAQTGWGREEDRQRAIEAGFDYHLVKPIDRDMFREILARPKTISS
jgi:PAS domain S-box-containing protein